MFKEFLNFLKLYGVIGLAIAVLIGGKANELVNAIVKELVMPFVGIVLPSGDWRTLGFEIAGAKFGVGAVMAASLDFLIVGFLVFLFSKKVLREEVVLKK